MDKEAAELKAKQLWGKTGFAVHHHGASGKIYIVGEENGPVRLQYGKGRSWEAAFNNAFNRLN